MPLSKKRNAELMRRIRYNRRLAARTQSNSVVPKQGIKEDINGNVPESTDLPPGVSYIDGDGHMVYE